MSWADCANGLFELFGGFFVLLNIQRILKDRKIAWAVLALYFIYGSRRRQG